MALQIKIKNSWVGKAFGGNEAGTTVASFVTSAAVVQVRLAKCCDNVTECNLPRIHRTGKENDVVTA